MANAHLSPTFWVLNHIVSEPCSRPSLVRWGWLLISPNPKRLPYMQGLVSACWTTGLYPTAFISHYLKSWLISQVLSFHLLLEIGSIPVVIGFQCGEVNYYINSKHLKDMSFGENLFSTDIDWPPSVLQILEGVFYHILCNLHKCLRGRPSHLFPDGKSSLGKQHGLGRTLGPLTLSVLGSSFTYGLGCSVRVWLLGLNRWWFGGNKEVALKLINHELIMLT